MDFNEWEGWYKEILDTLGFSREGDENTAELLDKILDVMKSWRKKTLQNSLLLVQALQ